MPKKGAQGGKQKPLKAKSKGRQELDESDLAFKKKQAADKKAAAEMAKKMGKKK